MKTDLPLLVGYAVRVGPKLYSAKGKFHSVTFDCRALTIDPAVHR